VVPKCYFGGSWPMTKKVRLVRIMKQDQMIITLKNKFMKDHIFFHIWTGLKVFVLSAFEHRIKLFALPPIKRYIACQKRVFTDLKDAILKLTNTIKAINSIQCFLSRISYWIGPNRNHSMTVFSYLSLATLNDTLLSEDEAFHREYP